MAKILSSKPSPKPATKPAPKAPAESFSLAQLRASQETKPKETLGLSQLRAAQEMAMGIAMARNPNYDTAMAHQNYANFMRDQQARLAAEQGQYTKGRLMGAPTNQMHDYNNLLQQGIQNSNTMNQGAMTNFANMQPGMQPTQPATANPAMPIAGQGMQQPRQTPAPRKFSTVKSPSIRFG